MKMLPAVLLSNTRVPMRHAIALALLSFSACASAAAEDYSTGMFMLEACNSALEGNSDWQAGLCQGAVSVARDVIDVNHATNKAPMFNACIPSNATLGQVIRVTTKFLNDHPKDLHHDFSLLILRALTETYPCP